MIGQRDPAETTHDNDPEVKKTSLVYVTDASNNGDKHLAVGVLERFLSWCRGKRVFAWILCYERNLRSQNHDRSDLQTTRPIPPISLTELVNAKNEILKHIQGSNLRTNFVAKERKLLTKQAILSTQRPWSPSRYSLIFFVWKC